MITLAQFGNPAPNLVQNANFTIGILNEIFSSFPGAFRFTSGYRTPAHNARVGGVANSYHLTGLAGDFVPVNGNNTQHESAIRKILNKYGYELLYHDVASGLHFHIEPAPHWNKQTSAPSIAPVLNATAGFNSPLLIAGLLLILIFDD